MATIFYDGFDGTGAVIGHTPDTGAAGNWTSSGGGTNLSRSSGAVVSSATGGVQVAVDWPSVPLSFDLEVGDLSAATQCGLSVEVAATDGSLFSYVSTGFSAADAGTAAGDPDNYPDGAGVYATVASQLVSLGATLLSVKVAELGDGVNRIVSNIFGNVMTVQAFGPTPEPALASIPLDFDAFIGDAYHVRFVMYNTGASFQALTIKDAEALATEFWTDKVGAVEVMA
ncbi:MAG: hypothetical protein AAB131_18100 [Actinomycetota bacterium]